MQNTVPPVVPLTVGDVWARVRRRPVLVVVPAVLGLAAGVGYALLAPPTYNSTASVVVQPLISDQFGGVNIANVINMATEAQVAQSSQVAGMAAKRLKVPAGQVSDGLSIATPQGTQVIELHYSADTQQAAADGAQVVAESYLAYREGAAAADVDRRLAAIQKQIDDANLKLATRTGSQSAYQDSLRSLLADQRTLTAVKATAGGRVISAASWPGIPSAPRAGVDIPIGLVGGALVGLALALLWPAGARLRAGGSLTDAARRAGSRPSSGLDELRGGSAHDAGALDDASDDDAFGDDDSDVDDSADGRGHDSAPGRGEGLRRPTAGTFAGRPDGGRNNGRPGRNRFDRGRPGSGRPGGGPGGTNTGGAPGSGGYLVGGPVPVSGGSGNGGSGNGGSDNGGSRGSAPSAPLGDGGPRAVRTTAQATGRPAQPVAPATTPQARPAPGPVGPASAAVAPPSPAPATRASVWQAPPVGGPADGRRPDVPELDRLVRQAGPGLTATLSSSQLVPPQAAPSEPLSLDVVAPPARATDKPPAPRTAPEARKDTASGDATEDAATEDAFPRGAGAKDGAPTDTEAKNAKDDPEPPAPESLPWFRR